MQNEHCTYSVRMPTTLRQQLERLAEAEDRHPSQVVRRLIRRACAEMEQRKLLSTDQPIPTQK
ncbi:MAG: hypothetical protein GY832_40620 [Chloroflexi bacterium]|nr:hypothetical protein [Chloroflexota bacterium]